VTDRRVSDVLTISQEARLRESAGREACLGVGQRLGPYEVTGKLGAGGMGEVYKARDTRLARTVAIKVLRAGTTTDPARRRRFEHEARAVAALNHPHICALYDIGSCSPEPGSAAIDFLVMEHLEGETLADRVARGPMPLEDALTVGAEIAGALEAAHRQNVVHRDLKPGNIILTGSGAKLLDFGLAKLKASADDDRAAELSTVAVAAPLTVEGLIVGTLPYMAPEQVEGKPADARTDLWALGAILYEMLTGRRAFDGASSASMIASILGRDPPPLSVLQAHIPADLDRLVHRCLSKAPGERPDSADAVAGELRRLLPVSGGNLHVHRRRRQTGVLVGIVALLMIAAGLLWYARSPATPASIASPSTVQAPSTVPVPIPLTSLPGDEEDAVLSPDGRQVAFLWRRRAVSDLSHLYVQLVGRGEPLQLTRAEDEYLYPAWNHDTTEVAVLRRTPAGHDVLGIPALGGIERLLVSSMAPPFGIDFSPDGRTLAYIDRAAPTEQPAVFLLSLATGQKRRLSTPQPIQGQRTLDALPRFSPKGSRVAFQRVMEGTGGVGPILLSDLAGGAPSVAVPQRVEVSFDFDWRDESTIVLAVASDKSSMLAEVPLGSRASGERPSSLERFRLPYGSGARSVSIANGRLVFSQYFEDMNVWRVPGPLGAPGGVDQPVINSTREDIAYDYSPDGSTIVFMSDRATEAKARTVWICDADGNNPRQLSHLGPWATWPQFLPDGRLIFNRDDGAVYAADVRGGVPTKMTADEFAHWLPSASHDGRWLLFDSNRGGDYRQVWRMEIATGTMTQLTRSPGTKFRPLESGGYVYYYKPVVTDSFAVVRTAIRAHDIFRVPVGGGLEELIVRGVPYHYWAVWRNMLVYIRYPERGDAVLEMMDLPTRTVRLLRRMVPDTELAYRAVPYLPVSPDGRWILLAKNDRSGSDVMVVDGGH
jgi:serine/threonine protein kinase/Tol biopolymer transport system component